MAYVKATIHCSPKEFQRVWSNLLGSNACPWMKIISPNSIQSEGENGMQPMDSLPAKSDKCKIITDKMECTSNSSPGNMFKEWLKSHYFGKCTFEAWGKQNGENKTKPNQTLHHPLKPLAVLGFFEWKKRGKRWRTQLLELYSFKWEVAAHTWRITSQHVIFHIKSLRPVELNRMFYGTCYSSETEVVNSLTFF